MANPVSPQVNKRTTLKDALSMMLDADVQTGIVVDRTGAVQGLLTVERSSRTMREGEHGQRSEPSGRDRTAPAGPTRRGHPRRRPGRTAVEASA